jgi:hypothetical protein
VLAVLLMLSVVSPNSARAATVPTTAMEAMTFLEVFILLCVGGNLLCFEI